LIKRAVVKNAARSPRGRRRPREPAAGTAESPVKVKDDWDRIFSEAEIGFAVAINVSDYGTAGPGS